MAPAAMLDEDDYAEIDGLLDQLGSDEGMRLDGVHGLLTAIIAGPEAIGPDEWLALVLGREQADVDDPQYRRLLGLLARLGASIERSLSVLAYEPIFAQHPGEGEEVLVDVGGWCDGFSVGIDLRADIWEMRLHQDPTLMELLSPIVALGVDDGVFNEVHDPEIPPLSEEEREELLQRLPGLLADLMQYWRDHPSPQAAPPGATLH